MELFDIVAGSSSVLMLAIGYTMGGVGLSRWLRPDDNRSILVLLASLLFFTLPSPWIATAILFGQELLGMDPISYEFHMFLSAWAIPLLPFFWMYITASLFEERPILKKLVIIIFGIMGLLFYTSVFGLESYLIEDIDGSFLRNISYLGLSNIVIIIYGISGLIFITPVYYWFSRKTESQLYSFRFLMNSLASALFVFASVFDALNDTHDVLLLSISRFFLLVSIVFLYFGYFPPTFVKNKFQS